MLHLEGAEIPMGVGFYWVWAFTVRKYPCTPANTRCNGDCARSASTVLIRRWCGKIARGRWFRIKAPEAGVVLVACRWPLVVEDKTTSRCAPGM